MSNQKASQKRRGTNKKSSKLPRAAVPKSDYAKSKADACLSLLRRTEGAASEQMQKATGWQPHSVRGFLSGKVKKMEGFTLTSEKSDGGALRYHVKAT